MKLAGWVAASALAHGALLAAVMLGVIPLEYAEVEPEPVTIEITALPAAIQPAPLPEPDPIVPIEETAPAPEPPPTPAPVVEPPPPQAREPRATAPGNTVPENTVSMPSLPGPMVEVPEVSQTGRSPIDEERERARLRALVDPTRVARGGFDYGPGPSQRGGPAGLAPLHGPGPSEAEIERGLASGLRSEAMTKRHTTREPFRLQRRADGTQVWSGPRLTGIIQPDGSVRFEDRPNVQTNGISASGTFDLTEAIMGASGQDPLRAEREYFMRQTEEVRARLEAEHRGREMSQGLSRLPGRLEGIWSATRRTTEARRARIFSIWDEATEDDESGREARAIVLRWIRERLPAGSADAFTADELRRFNASRESREEFAPY